MGGLEAAGIVTQVETNFMHDFLHIPAIFPLTATPAYLDSSYFCFTVSRRHSCSFLYFFPFHFFVVCAVECAAFYAQLS